QCNQTVKFTDLFKEAKNLNADALVTGHYVKSITDGENTEMYRGLDSNRDQSYFLFNTTKNQLNFLRFPLGNLLKDETREIARKLDLNVADKPDSQDICFVPEGGYASVIERLRPGAGEPGKIVHLDGRVLGEHKGIIYYTIGQRRGIGIGGGDPLYVIKLDPIKKQVIVGPKEALEITRVDIKELNWLGETKIPETGRKITVKVRSTRPAEAATLYPGDDETKAYFTLDKPEYGVSAGQAAVFYDEDRLLGGGWIIKAQSSFKL
ncbi:MAG: tRNA 2-thiouridine(34) synthase MnmA, partial [Emcibacteraceae bacterium]|nr:tRNA 2-thiouridine(34) synthase MnmA [Emcibacteraceae bacterium]